MTKLRLNLACAAAVLCGSALFWAQGPWQAKPYSEWTAEDVRQILQQSPWVQKKTITVSSGGMSASSLSGRGGFATPPPGGDSRRPVGDVSLNQHIGESGQGVSPAPTAGRVEQFQVLVYWASSLAVRQAAARFQQLHGGSYKGEELSRQPAEYLIVVRKDTTQRDFLSGFLRLYGGITEAKLREGARLEVHRGKRKVSATRFEIVTHNSVPVEVRFYFPRELDGKPLITPDEDRVEFSSKTAFDKIKVEFNPQAMMRDGKPDL